MTLPFETWRDIVETLEGVDPWDQVTRCAPDYWVALWMQGMTPKFVAEMMVEF